MNLIFLQLKLQINLKFKKWKINLKQLKSNLKSLSGHLHIEGPGPLDHFVGPGPHVGRHHLVVHVMVMVVVQVVRVVVHVVHRASGPLVRSNYDAVSANSWTLARSRSHCPSSMGSRRRRRRSRRVMTVGAQNHVARPINKKNYSINQSFNNSISNLNPISQFQI